MGKSVGKPRPAACASTAAFCPTMGKSVGKPRHNAPQSGSIAARSAGQAIRKTVGNGTRVGIRNPSRSPDFAANNAGDRGAWVTVAAKG